MVIVNLRNTTGGEEWFGRVVVVDRRTVWGNRFRIGQDGSRLEVIEKFRLELLQKVQTDPDMVPALARLHGQVLGCWCAPEPCHAEVLERAARWAHQQMTTNLRRCRDAQYSR